MTALMTIVQKMAEIVRDDTNSVFDDLKYIWYPTLAPELFGTHMPSIEIVIENELTAQTMTGDIHERVYQGFFLVSVQYHDLATTDDKLQLIGSGVDVVNKCDRLVELFKSNQYCNLDGLTFVNGSVIQVHIGLQATTYAPANRTEREDNLHNIGIVPFEVDTHEVIT